MTRMNITIPEELAHRLEHLVGPRKKSQFIVEAVQDRMERMRRNKLEKQLEEGYKARREESLAISEDFEPADLEGWDEY